MKNDVDSIAYSHYDADSLYNSEWIMQEIHTSDSVYRIPLAAIDSVLFYTTETMYPCCPDNHHPHAIDLGLPSGTKWSCCNVGASSPAEYGGYYAWGETWEKNLYSDANYAFTDSYTGLWYTFVDIGSDISGTQYDVAHVRMGAPWRMPSVEQQKELIELCTQVWTQQNGVNGILVTGPNGGQVFLPAAGYRGHNGELRDGGANGYYWSCMVAKNGEQYRNVLGFNSDRWYNGLSYCSGGQSVRAACP